MTSSMHVPSHPPPPIQRPVHSAPRVKKEDEERKAEEEKRRVNL